MESGRKGLKKDHYLSIQVQLTEDKSEKWTCRKWFCTDGIVTNQWDAAVAVYEINSVTLHAFYVCNTDDDKQPLLHMLFTLSFWCSFCA